eukprot:Skav234902  [mRNA]  locus=scaffold840:734585:740526:+ [translate_table: standard]
MRRGANERGKLRVALKAKGKDSKQWEKDGRRRTKVGPTFLQRASVASDAGSALKAAADMGCDVYFDWDAARSAGEPSLDRGRPGSGAMGPARSAQEAFAHGEPEVIGAFLLTEVRAAVPHQMLAYNLSPSFNWDSALVKPLLGSGAGMTDAQMESFIWDLAAWQKGAGLCRGWAKLGFCWQFITLAGFHCDALSIDRFAKDGEYSTRGAYAYVSMIQREERKHKVETLTHQKWILGRNGSWSGSEILDEMGNVVSGGLSSTGGRSWLSASPAESAVGKCPWAKDGEQSV